MWLECFFYTENVSGSNPLLSNYIIAEVAKIGKRVTLRW